MKSAPCPMPGARTAESARFSMAVNPGSIGKRWVRADMAVRAPKHSDGSRPTQATPGDRRAAHARAFTIIECLVYAGLFAVVIGLGTVAFYRCFDNMKGLRRNADEITKALHVGEQWRADVRMANAEQRLETGGDPTLHLPNKQGEIIYRFSTGAVFRKTGSGPWTCVLTNVKSSGIIFDVRSHVTAWCWELELQPTQKNVRTRPLFTFLAVPNAGKQP